MVFDLTTHPDFQKKVLQAGFSNAQFKKLDALFLRAASQKIIVHRTVDCDFDEGVATFCYHKSLYHPALFKFIIRRASPNAVMYELWKAGKGRIAKSGLFERVFSRLETEIEQC